MNEKKKELISQYKEREIVGGVYAVRNTQNGKTLLETALDINSARNRFEFSRNTGSCVYMKLQSDWNEHGGSAFVFETLEELKKGETQSQDSFRDDLGVLKGIWLEKMPDAVMY